MWATRPLKVTGEMLSPELVPFLNRLNVAIKADAKGEG
jgi:hypothetical protein